jgi:hypothetical protein
MINVVHAEEYQRPDFNAMIDTTARLLDEYNISNGSSSIHVDGANPSFIRALKAKIGEDPDYPRIIDYYKRNYPSIYDLQFLSQHIFVVPVPFSKEHKYMLAHCKEMPEYHNGCVAINPRHNKLIISLRTAVENGEGSLDKEATSYDDLLIHSGCQ